MAAQHPPFTRPNHVLRRGHLREGPLRLRWNPSPVSRRLDTHLARRTRKRAPLGPLGRLPRLVACTQAPRGQHTHAHTHTVTHTHTHPHGLPVRVRMSPFAPRTRRNGSLSSLTFQAGPPPAARRAGPANNSSPGAWGRAQPRDAFLRHNTCPQEKRDVVRPSTFPRPR